MRNETRVCDRLQPILSRVFNAMDRGTNRFLRNPEATVFSATTRANMIHDYVFNEITNELDGVSWINRLEGQNIISFLRVEDRPVGLLWLKQMGSARNGSNVDTEANRRLRDSGQLEMFERNRIICLGYLLNRERGTLQKMVLAPPAPRGSQPEWWIDITVRPVSSIGIATTSSNDLLITRSSNRQRLA